MRAWPIGALILVFAAALAVEMGPEKRRALVRTAAAEYYYRSGWRTLQRRDLTRAKALFARAQAQATRPAEMSARIGLAYAYWGHHFQADRSLTRAIQLQPHQPIAVYEMLGGLRWRRGDLESATVLLERAAELEPNDWGALNDLGYLYAERGIKLNRAIALLRRALDVLPPDASPEDRWTVEDSLAWAYYQRGEYQRALPLVERADKGLNGRKLTQPDVAYHLGMTYLALNRRRSAIGALQRAAKGRNAAARAVLSRLGRVAK